MKPEEGTTRVWQQKLGLALVVLALSGSLAACSQKPDLSHIDRVYYFYSDLPGNGHSRGYMYPTDITADYRNYPGFNRLGPLVTH